MLSNESAIRPRPARRSRTANGCHIKGLVAADGSILHCTTALLALKRGKLYAAVVPVWQALREAPNLSTLRGSANGCFGDAASFVNALRNEWP